MTDFLARADGLALAYAHRPGTGPTLVFLPGYRSDMQGSKALALDAWAAEQGRAVLRLDYAGNGASGGAFEDGTLESWRDDALFLIDRLTHGPLILVGSSMGGWIALLVALARPDRVAGLVGIAAAPDFTEWSFDAERRATLLRDGRLAEPSPYSDKPTVTTRAFWESGQRNLLLGSAIPIRAPVRLLQGQADAEVPWQIALRLAESLAGDDVRLTLVKDGDHRLSRAQDIALLIETIAELT
ncbi:alpha/beta fold hydrolase [Sphingomonas jatrophae]|uniref:Palmitoyl-protein thioesterase ABHD10, mitochondrial n=1 Tax=Sphingomonas jatrophae TaxID=1166337 RepID=A0A1I6LMV6_9SPHN|nr:alpha/beta hydrolase [Sphingomonas jatrophae]SFS04836.1 Serine aminopeptidase, S33 [Sphingomonas jatrophae]